MPEMLLKPINQFMNKRKQLKWY